MTHSSWYINPHPPFSPFPPLLFPSPTSKSPSKISSPDQNNNKEIPQPVIEYMLSLLVWYNPSIEYLTQVVQARYGDTVTKEQVAKALEQFREAGLIGY